MGVTVLSIKSDQRIAGEATAELFGRGQPHPGQRQPPQAPSLAGQDRRRGQADRHQPVEIVASIFFDAHDIVGFGRRRTQGGRSGCANEHSLSQRRRRVRAVDRRDSGRIGHRGGQRRTFGAVSGRPDAIMAVPVMMIMAVIIIMMVMMMIVLVIVMMVVIMGIIIVGMMVMLMIVIVVMRVIVMMVVLMIVVMVVMMLMVMIVVMMMTMVMVVVVRVIMSVAVSRWIARLLPQGQPSQAGGGHTNPQQFQRIGNRQEIGGQAGGAGGAQTGAG